MLGLFATGSVKPLKVIARVCVEVVQNTPLLLQMCFLYYALAFGGVSLGIIRTGILALGIYHGAYVSEVIRAGIEAIPRGQFDAAASQGFGYIQKMYYIILPQSIKIILPPILRDFENSLSVFIYAPVEARLLNCTETLGMEEKEARRMIREVDRSRELYHRRYCPEYNGPSTNKDLMIDSSAFGVEKTAELLAYIVRDRFGEQ